MMAEMTGMAISNASMYDGTTATAEAMMMAYANSRKADTVAYSATLDPKTVAVLKTYAHFHGIKLQEIAQKDGVTDKEDLKNQLAEGHIAGFIAQQPNYYGVVEDFTGVADACHDKKALFVLNSVIADLALTGRPGALTSRQLSNPPFSASHSRDSQKYEVKTSYSAPRMVTVSVMRTRSR